MQEPRVERIRHWLERRSLAIVVALACVGGWLRLQDLGTHALNPDEGLYVAIAAAPSWGELARALVGKLHPPGFFVFVRLALGVGESPALLRAPAWAFGVASIFGVFLVGRRAFGPLAGCLAAALLTFSPGAITLSQLVRPYSLQLAALSFGLWSLLRYLDGRRRSALVGYALFLALALVTHYGSVIVFAALAGWLGVLVVADPRLRRHWRELLVAHAGLVLLFAALNAPRLRAFESSNTPYQSVNWLEPFLARGPGDVWLAIVGVQRYLFGTGLDGLATLLFVFGLAFALWRGAGLRSIAVPALFAIGLAGGLSLAGLYPFGGTRHATHLFVLIVPLVAEGVRGVISGPGVWAGVGAAALAGLALTPALPDALVGASKLRYGLQVERIATVEQVDALPVRRLRDGRNLVLVDEQTFYFLRSAFRDAELRGEIDESLPYRVRDWGEAELLVAERWQLRAGPERLRDTDHWVGYAEQVAPLFLQPGAGGAREVWMVAAGWGPLPFAALRKIDAGLPPAASFIEEIDARGYGGVLRFDPDRFSAWARTRRPR